MESYSKRVVTPASSGCVAVWIPYPQVVRAGRCFPFDFCLRGGVGHPWAPWIVSVFLHLVDPMDGLVGPAV
jgi:hypothetical protein